MGENFRCKARITTRGYRATTPQSLTCSSAVSHDRFRIALKMAALDGLSALACDIQNECLAAPCHEKIHAASGPDFGSDSRKTMIAIRAP